MFRNFFWRGSHALAAIFLFAACAAPTPPQPAGQPAPQTGGTAQLAYAAPCVPESATKPIPSGKKRLVIGTGSEGGLFYPAGNALAGVLSKSLTSTEALTKTIGGSEENIRALAKGEIDLGFASQDVAYEAANALGNFKGQSKASVCALAQLSASFLHILAAPAAGINAVEDMRGKRVAIGTPGSPAEIAATRVFSAAGMNLQKDIVGANMNLEQSLAALKAGQVDALFWMGSQSVPQIYEMMAGGGARYVSIAPLYEKLRKDFGLRYAQITLPAGAYPNMPGDVAGIGIGSALLVNANMNTQLARDILQAVFDNAEIIRASHPELAKFTQKGAATPGAVPFHPGAVQFYAR
ncbi:MAG TPA: TAXI family TRAP transporter solute-binding subunit [Thermoflexales bacterium]|nr:TAXI family TRAP transporter solute-binding subunit [Thermoflexales bacterium]HQW36323.1 TAXI family TRAP transporter solute-binding subunit [Thermoflexales bacterium]